MLPRNILNQIDPCLWHGKKKETNLNEKAKRDALCPMNTIKRDFNGIKIAHREVKVNKKL